VDEFSLEQWAEKLPIGLFQKDSKTYLLIDFSP